MNNSIIKFIFLITAFGLILGSCESDVSFTEQRTEISPTVSTELVRYDRIIENLDTADILSDYANKTKEIQSFRSLHDRQLLGLTSEEALIKELKTFQADTSYQNLYKEVQVILKDLSDEKQAIDQTLENYLSLTDKSNEDLPSIYGFISGFTYQAFLFDDGQRDGIGLGLEMYLGEEFPYEKAFASDPRFSSYLTRTYNKEHLPRKIAEVLAEDMLGPPEDSDFLSLMIWGGKKLHLIDQMISFAPDSIVTEYTQDQLNWCRSNEAEMWSFFFEHDLFYETDIRKFNKLISPAPTSPGMPPESPGQTANYMGWQIIKAYLQRNPDVSIREMILMRDAQKILDLSKYKPKR